jgi:aldehyde dehydrogenase
MATTEQSTTFEAPGRPGSPVQCKARYDNFIGGHWVAPIDGEYRDNLTPATGQPICEVAHSGAQDIELALDAAHAAKDAWGETSTEGFSLSLPDAHFVTRAPAAPGRPDAPDVPAEDEL